MKQSLGFSKRSHSSVLFNALGIRKASQGVTEINASLLKRIMCVSTPVQDLNIYFLSLYLSRNVLIPGTLVQRLVSFNLSPIFCAFNSLKLPGAAECGVADSLRHLLQHSNFINGVSTYRAALAVALCLRTERLCA